MTDRTVGEVQVGRDARVYAEGWQSWSPTTWYGLGEPSHRPAETRQHLMRFRPGVDVAAEGWQGEGLLVVDPGTGAPVHCFAATGPAEKVATVRAAPCGDRLLVTADGDVQVTAHLDAGTALARAGESLARRAGVGALRTAPRVWCTWYQYFEQVTTHDIEENLAGFDDAGLPVDVVQIDDGWSQGLGQWNRPRESFGSLPNVIDAIQAAGRRVGLWLAPFIVGVDTDVARAHPDWLVGPAGHNWGQDLVGLDLTHPAVRDYLQETLHGLRELGIDYVKLDFLYGGAIPGRRHLDVTGEAAYRAGLQLVRDSLGADAYLLGCGAPLLPSLGLVDAMRVSPDTFHEGDEDGSAGLRGLMSLEARAWQHGRFWVNDPDCLVARPSFALREEWSRVVRRFGGLRSCSDRVAELDPWGLEATRHHLSEVPAPVPFASSPEEA